MTPTERPLRAIARLLALSVALAAAPFSSSAEEEPAPESSRASRAIEEIVVTAQKKVENVQKVPISISVLSGDFLKEAGIDNLHELAGYTPNVRFVTNACCTSVFIRGFGTPFAASAFDPTVGLAQDELSIPKEIYMSDPLFDIERFEVLRGPQGTLFGKNTPAGLFNVATGAPSDEFTGYILGRAGGLGAHREEAAIGGPLFSLGNVAQFRLAGVDLKEAGDVHNTKLDLDEPATGQRAARAKLALRPLEGLDILLIGSAANTDGRFFHIQNYLMRPATVEFLRHYDPQFEDDGFDHQNSINLKDGLNRDTTLLQSNIRYDWGDLGWVRDLKFVAVLGDTAFNQDAALDVDFSPADVANLVSPTRFRYDQQSAELRLSGFLPGPFHFGEIESLVGVLLFDSHFRSDSPLRAGRDFGAYLLSPAGFELATGQPPPGGVGFQSLTQVTDALGLDPISALHPLEGDGAEFLLDQKLASKAGFGQLAWHLTEEWTASFGARFTTEDKRAHLVNRCFQPGVVCGALGIQAFDLHRERSETDFSPKVTVQYSPLHNLSLFATRGQGFKSGGFNNFSFTTTGIEVEPEKTVSWETGAKGTLFDGALNYGATIFHMSVKDLQLQSLMGAVVLVRNAASARSQGVELESLWYTPWEPLSIRGAGAVTDARFTDFRNAPAPASSSSNVQDLSGHRMPFAPKVQLSFTPKLDFPLRSLQLPGLLPHDLVFTTAFDVQYRSAAFLDIDLDPHTLQGAYTLVNGRLGLSTADKSLSLIVSVNNIMNTDAFEYATDSILFPGGFVVMQEFQRNYAVEARYTF